MKKYQIRYVSRVSGNLSIKSGYEKKQDAENVLRKAGFKPESGIWIHEKWFAKIWEDKT